MRLQPGYIAKEMTPPVNREVPRVEEAMKSKRLTNLHGQVKKIITLKDRFLRRHEWVRSKK